MIIFDAHLDLAWNAIDWNRDLRLPVREDSPGRERRRHDRQGPRLQYGLVPRSAPRQGRHLHRHAAAAAAAHRRHAGHPALSRHMAAAYGAAYGQLAYYRGLEQEGHAALDQGLAARSKRTSSDWKADENSTDAAARLHPQHGRGRPGPVARPGRGMVRRRPAHHRPGPLRRQPLCPRHRHRRRLLRARPGRCSRRWSASA